MRERVFDVDKLPTGFTCILSLEDSSQCPSRRKVLTLSPLSFTGSTRRQADSWGFYRFPLRTGSTQSSSRPAYRAAAFNALWQKCSRRENITGAFLSQKTLIKFILTTSPSRPPGCHHAVQRGLNPTSRLA